MAEDGFDVSIYQSGSYAGGGGFSYGIGKLSEGVGYKDPAADRHMRAILNQPVVPGGYHFGRPDLNPGTSGAYTEADWFWRVATSYGGAIGMLLGLDAESAGGSVQWCSDFCGRLTWRLGGYNPWLYSYLDWMQSRGLVGSGLLSRCPLWFAWPDTNGSLPNLAVSMQQYGLTAVPGISGQVDANRFFGTRQQLERLTVGGIVVTARPPGEHAMWHPTVAGRFDDLVVGTNSHVYHTFGTVPDQRGVEDWGGAGIPGTERCDWSPDGQHLLGRVVGVDARIYYRMVKFDGTVEYDWTPAIGEGAELPPSGPIGPPGPPYDDTAVKAELARHETVLQAIKTAIS
jgi:hypothetical protein